MPSNCERYKWASYSKPLFKFTGADAHKRAADTKRMIDQNWGHIMRDFERFKVELVKSLLEEVW